jgi:cytochrome b6-f complex iron-sulfur subunit
VGGTLLAVAAGWTVYESLRPLASAASGGTINLGDPARYEPETATYIPQGRLFVANTGTYLYALSQKCPHLGCRIPFCDSSGHFECPCHGSKYDIGGEWIVGPAPRGMDRFQLHVDKATNTLIADTSKLITGPPRGSKRFYKPAKGPSCVPKG